MNKRLVIYLFAFSAGCNANLSADTVADRCGSKAVGVVAELRAKDYPDLSEREIRIARSAAAYGCIAANWEADGQVREEAEPATDGSDDPGEQGFFDALTGERVDKAGNKRLKRRGRY